MQSVYRELGLSRQAVHQQWSRDDRQTMQYEQIIPIVRNGGSNIHVWEAVHCIIV
ncbi:MAG: hypothetical protein IPK35_19260 [Saprospiraceae bacterium]|nr:hypothetical protein [Saprospiraceae bacterium]